MVLVLDRLLGAAPVSWCGRTTRRSPRAIVHKLGDGPEPELAALFRTGEARRMAGERTDPAVIHVGVVPTAA